MSIERQIENAGAMTDIFGAWRSAPSPSPQAFAGQPGAQSRPSPAPDL